MELMFHMPVDVIATFNVQGKIKPNYIRLEDENHALQTYKIESIVFSREENYAGISTLVFGCNIRAGRLYADDKHQISSSRRISGCW